jgi:DNA polymerase (family 10)
MVRARVSGIDVLHGVEVDILHDGALDFPDHILEGFDIVLASLHDDGGHDAARLAERYLAAIRHPLVNIITHPANRSPGVRAGYDLDFDRLFDAAVETGTAMEVDGGPGHLDMDGVLARRAAARGVTIVIDSDCHRADALERQMEFGVGTARRGWIEPRHVLNTRTAADIRAFVADKRSRR